MPWAARTAMAEPRSLTNRCPNVASAYSTRNASVNSRSPNCCRNLTSRMFIETLVITNAAGSHAISDA